MGLSMRASKSMGIGMFVLTSLATAAGCSDPAPATPRIALASNFGPGTEVDENGQRVNGPEQCGFASEPWLTIGDFTNRADIKYVLDGDTTGDPPGRVAIVCTVKPEGDRFRVDGNVTIDGVGSVTIGGSFTPSGEQTNVTASFQRIDTGTFEQTDCTASYDSNSPMGVAAGRVWARLNCPLATYGEQNRTCRATAEFRFENCTQE